MIHAIGRDLEAALVAKGCPFKVVDREATSPTTWRNVIVIENGPDKFGPARSQSINPRRYYTRFVGGTITIYAQSTDAGAMEFEHRRVAERVLDLVLVALRSICASRRQPLTIDGGQFVNVVDLDASERRSGAAYQLSFAVERAVFDRTWAGAAAAEADLTAVANTTNVSRAGRPEDDGDPLTPETACGA